MVIHCLKVHPLYYCKQEKTGMAPKEVGWTCKGSFAITAHFQWSSSLLYICHSLISCVLHGAGH